jgi:hypothetical protein
VLGLLDEVLDLGEARFRENLDFLWPLLTGLIGAGSVEVRQRVGRIFETRIRELLPLKK